MINRMHKVLVFAKMLTVQFSKPKAVRFQAYDVGFYGFK